MKVILVYGLMNVNGGIEKYLLSMQSKLNNSIRFNYIIGEKNNIHTSQIKSNGGNVIYAPLWEEKKKFISSIYGILRKYRKTSKVIYINISDLSFEILTVIFFSKFLKYKIILHSHNAMLEKINGTLARNTHKIIEKMCLLEMNDSKIKKLAVSSRSGQYIYKNMKYQILPSGINTEEFIFDEKIRGMIRKTLNIGNDQKLIGVIGRLTSIKNINYAVKIFYELTTRNIDGRLLIVGEGKARDSIEKFAQKLGISEKISFYGAADNVSQLIQGMDLILAPSLSEGLSLVAIEAQAAGTPVICSKNRFPKEIQITPLLKFCDLKKTNDWISESIVFLKSKPAADKSQYNSIVRQSMYDLKNSAEYLKEVVINDL